MHHRRHLRENELINFDEEMPIVDVSSPDLRGPFNADSRFIELEKAYQRLLNFKPTAIQHILGEDAVRNLNQFSLFSKPKYSAKDKRRRKESHQPLLEPVNPEIDAGLRTIKRDEKYGITERIVKYYGKDKSKEDVLLLAGDVDMVKLVKQGNKAIYLGAEEATIVDPNSKYLKKYYRNFKKNHYDEIIQSEKEVSVEQVLRMVCMHTQLVCGKNNSEHDDKHEIRKKMRARSDAYTVVGEDKEEISVLALEKVMAKSAANCRYHAMYTSYVLSRLIDEGKLPKGEVYLVRDNLRKGGAHTWVCYKPHNTKELFLIDSYWKKTGVILDLNNKDQLNQARSMKYGEDATNRMVARYGKIEPQNKSEFRLNRRF